MNRYDITAWCDFVRGVANPEEEERMRARLTADPKARRAAAAMQQVADVALADHEDPVPEHALASRRLRKRCPAGRRS